MKSENSEGLFHIGYLLYLFRHERGKIVEVFDVKLD